MINFIEYENENNKGEIASFFFYYDTDKMSEDEAIAYLQNGGDGCPNAFHLDENEHNVLKKLFDQLMQSNLKDAYEKGKHDLLMELHSWVDGKL